MKKLSLLSKVLLFTILFGLCFTAKSSFAVTNNTPIKTLEVKKNVVEIPVQNIDVDKQITSEYNLTLKAGEPVSVVFTQNDKILQDWFWNWYTSKGTEGYATTVRNLLVGLKQTPEGESKQYTVKNIFGTKGAIVNIIVEEPDMFVAGAEGSLKKLNNYTKYSNRDVKYLDVNGDGLITSYDIKYLNDLFVKYDSDYDYVVNSEIDKADKDKVEAAIKNTKGIGKTNVIYPEQELKLQVIDDKVEEGRTWGLESVDVRKLQYQITYKDGSKVVDVTEYFSLEESKENTSIAILSVDSKNVTKNRVPNDKVLTLTFRKKPYGAPEGLCKETDSEIESQKIAEFNFKIENRVVAAAGCDLYLDVDSQGLSEKTALLKEYNGNPSRLKVWNEATGLYETTEERYVVVPRTVTYNGIEYKIRGICKDAFDGNSTIDYIVLGNWIDEIQDGAFDGMTKLKGIELLTDTEAVVNKYDPDGLYVGHYSKNTKYTAIDGVLYELAEDGTLSTLVKYPVAKPNTEYTLLKCNTIGYGAFKDAKNLEKVIFNTSVYSIHDEAFYGCTKLSGIELFNVYEIGEKAFYNVGKEIGTVREEVPEEVSEEISEEISGEESEEEPKIIPTIIIDSIGLQTIGKTLTKYPEQIMSDELELASYVNVTDNALTGSDVFYGVPNVGYYSDNYAMDLYIRAKGDNDFKSNPELSERYILLDADEEVEAEDGENETTEDGIYDIVGNKVIVNPTNGEYNINVDETTTKLIRDVAEGDVISLNYLRNSTFEKIANKIKDAFKNDAKNDGTIEENLYHWALTNVDFLPLDSDDNIVKDKEIKKNKAEGESTTYTADENGWYNAFKDEGEGANKPLFDLESFEELKAKFGKIQEELENSPIFLKTQNEVANNQKSFTSWFKGIGQKEKCIQQNSAVIKNIFDADENIEKIIVKANLRNCLIDQYGTKVLKKFKPVIYIEILREDIEDPNNFGKITIDPAYSNNLWNISSDVEIDGNVISISAATFDGIKKEYSKTGFAETTDLKFVLQNKNGSTNIATNWSYELKDGDTYIKNVPVTLNKDNVGGVTVSIPDISEYGYEKLDLTLIATAVGQDYIYKFNIAIYSRQQTKDGATYYLKTLSKEDSSLNEAVFTRFSGEGDRLVIPNMLSAYPESEGLVENVKVVELASESICNCPNLVDIKFELNVKELPEKLISGCPNLASITIPKTVEKIDPRFVWNDCISLSEYNVEEGNAYFTSEDGVLYNKDKTELLLYPFQAGESGELFTIPTTVRTIGKYAFAYNNNLSNIYLPDFITCVKPFAFAYIKNLKEVVLSSAIDCIGGMDKDMRNKISISGVLSGSLKSEYENGNVGNIFAGYGENYKNVKVYYDKNNEQLLQYACLFGNVDYTDKDKYERKREMAYLSKLPEADFVRLEIFDIYFDADPIEQTYYAGEKLDMSVLPETITVEYNKEVNGQYIEQVIPVTSSMLKYVDPITGEYISFENLTFSEDLVELSKKNDGKLEIVLCYENANTNVVTANIIPAVLDIDESGIERTSFINEEKCINYLKDIIKVYPLNSKDGKRVTNDLGEEVELRYVTAEELQALTTDEEKQKTYSLEVREDEETGEKYVVASRNGGLPGYGEFETPIKIYLEDELVSFKVDDENTRKVLEEEISDYILYEEDNVIYIIKENLPEITSLYAEVNTVPNKKSYTLGVSADKDIDLTGMQLKVKYRHFDEFGNPSPIELDTIDLSTPNTNNVYVETSNIEELMIASEKYGSVNEEQLEIFPMFGNIKTVNSFEINVLPGILEKISISNNPDQLEYLIGEIFNDTGLVIEGTFNVNGDEITGIINKGYEMKIGTKPLTSISYDEEGNPLGTVLENTDNNKPVTVTFKASDTNVKSANTVALTVAEEKIQEIALEIKDDFYKQHFEGDEFEHGEGSSVIVKGRKVSAEDESKEEWVELPITDYEVSGDALKEIDGKLYFNKTGKITFTYNKNINLSTSIDVIVPKPEDELVGFVIKDENDLAVLKEEIQEYINCEEKNVIYIAKNDLATIPSLYVEIVTAPSKKSYTLGIKGDENINIEGLKLKLLYTHYDEYGEAKPIELAEIRDNGLKDVSLENNNFNVLDLMTIAGKTESKNQEQLDIYAIYNGIKSINTFEINVLPGLLQKISVKSDPYQLEYVNGEIFNDTGLVIEGIFTINGKAEAGIISKGYSMKDAEGNELQHISYDENGEAQGTPVTVEGPVEIRYEASKSNVKIANMSDLVIVEAEEKLEKIKLEISKEFYQIHPENDEFIYGEEDNTLKVVGLYASELSKPEEEREWKILDKADYEVSGDAIKKIDDSGKLYFDKTGKITFTYKKNRNLSTDLDVIVLKPDDGLVGYIVDGKEDITILEKEIPEYIKYEEGNEDTKVIYIAKEDLAKIPSIYVEMTSEPNKDMYTLNLKEDENVDFSGIELEVRYKHFDEEGNEAPIILDKINGDKLDNSELKVLDLMTSAEKVGSNNEEQLVICPVYNGINSNSSFEISVLPGILKAITIKESPIKFEYEAGEIFDDTTLIVEGTFTVNGEDVKGIINKGYVMTTEQGKVLEHISYDENGIAQGTVLDENDNGPITITFKANESNTKIAKTEENIEIVEAGKKVVAIEVETIDGLLSSNNVKVFSTDHYKFEEFSMNENEDNFSGIKVYGINTDNERIQLSESKYKVVCDGLKVNDETGKLYFAKTGKYPIKFVYNGNKNYSDSVEVNVTAPDIEKIEIVTAPQYYYYYSTKDQNFGLVNSNNEQAKLRIVYRDKNYVNPEIPVIEGIEPNVITFEDAMTRSEEFGKLTLPIIKAGSKVGTEGKVNGTFKIVNESIDGNKEEIEIKTEQFGYKVVDEIISVNSITLNKEKYLMSNRISDIEDEENHIGVEEVDWSGTINVKYREAGSTNIDLASNDVIKQFVSVETDKATGVRKTEWKIYIIAQGVNPKDYKTATVYTYEYPLSTVQKIEITKPLEDTSYDVTDTMPLSEGEVTVTYAYAVKGVKKKVFLTTEDVLKMDDPRLDIVLVNNDKNEENEPIEPENGHFENAKPGYYTAYIVFSANRTHDNVEQEATLATFPISISEEHYEVFLNATLDDEKWNADGETIYLEGQKASDNVYAIEMSNGSKYVFLCAGVAIPSANEEMQDYKMQSQEKADAQAKIIKNDFIYEPEVLSKYDTSFTITYKYDTRLTTTIDNIKVVNKEISEVNFLQNNMSKQQYFGDINWKDSEIEVVYNYKDADKLNISDLNEVRYFKVSDLIENGQIEVVGTPVDFNLEEKAYEITLNYKDADTNEVKQVFVKQRVEEKIEADKVVRYTSNLNSIGDSTAQKYTEIINSIGKNKFGLNDFDINDESTYKNKVSNVELTKFVLDLDKEISNIWIDNSKVKILDRVYNLNEDREIKYPLYNYKVEETLERNKNEEESLIETYYNYVPLTFNFMEEIKDMEISLLPGTKYLEGSLLQLDTGLVKITYKREGVNARVVTMSDERLKFQELTTNGVSNSKEINCEMQLNDAIGIGLKSFQSSENSIPFEYNGEYNAENKGLYGKWFVTEKVTMSNINSNYEIKSVELEKLPSKTEYKLGTDRTINLAGGLVKIVYKEKSVNGLEFTNVVELDNSNYFVIAEQDEFNYAYEEGICATCPITVALKGNLDKEITFNVKTVDRIAKKVTLLDSTKQYLQSEYLAGESLNTDKLTFVVWYDDYTQEYFTEGQEKEVTKLVYNEKEDKWEEKIETEIVKIDDYFAIYTRQYLKEVRDNNGNIVHDEVGNIVYERVSEDFAINTGTFTVPGENEIAKVYYKINMNAEPLTIENINVIGIKQAQIKDASLNRTTYVIGEKVDLEGGKLTVEYYNGETKEIDLTSPEISLIGVDTSHAGKDWVNPHMEFINTVGVIYGGSITPLDLTIIHPEQIEKIEVIENPRDYYNMGDNIDRSMGAINVTWINWKRYNGEYDDNNDKFIVGDYKEGENADKKSGVFTYRVPFDSSFLSEEDEPIRLSTDYKNYNIISAVNVKDEEGKEIKVFPEVVKVEYAKHLAGDSIVVEDKDSVLAKMTTEYPINVEDTITDRIEIDVEHSKINYLLGAKVQNSDLKVYKVSKFGERVLLDPSEYTLDEEATDLSSVGEHSIKVYYNESVKCYAGTQFEEIVVNGRNEKPYEDEVKVNVYTKEQSYTFLLTDEELEAFLNNAVDQEPVVEAEKTSAIQKLTDEELEKYIEQAEENSGVYKDLIEEKKIRDKAKKDAQEKLDAKIAKVKASVLSIENVDGKNEIRILRDEDRLSIKVRKPENEEKYREYDELDVSRYQLEFYYSAEGNEYSTRVQAIPLTDKMIMNAEEQALYGIKSLRCATGTKKGTEENEVIRVYKFAEAKAERTDKIGIIYSLDEIVTKHEENPEEIALRKLQPGYKEPEEKDKKPVLGEDYLYTSLDAVVMDCVVDSIKVTKSPAKDKYLIGEEFNPEGMVVTAYNKAKEEIRDLKYIEADEENKIEEQKEYTITPTEISAKNTEIRISFKNRLGKIKSCNVNVLANNYDGEDQGIKIYSDDEVIKIRITEEELANNKVEEKLADELISKEIVTKQVEVEPEEVSSEEPQEPTSEGPQEEEPKEMEEVPTGEVDLVLVKDKLEIKVIQPEEPINYFVDGSIQTEKYKVDVTYVETEKPVIDATAEEDAEPKVIQKVKLGLIPLTEEMLKEHYVFTKDQIDKEVEIEVNYYDATDKFTVKVNDNEIKKIEVAKEPNKKSYEIKDFDELAKLDLTGMEVKGYNVNGLYVKDLTNEEYTYEPVQIGIGEGQKHIYTIEIIYKNGAEEQKDLTAEVSSEETEKIDKISAMVDGFEVWIIDDVIKIQISKEDYEKVKDKIAQKVTSDEEKDGIVDLHLAPGTLSISIAKPENDTEYDVGTKLDLARYKVNLNYKSGSVDVDLLQVDLTEDMLEDELETFTIEQAGTEVEFAVSYLDLDTTFKVKVSRKQGQFKLGELKTVIFDEIEYIRIEDYDMTVKDLKDIIRAANAEEVVIEVFDTENELTIDTDKLETAMKVRISEGSKIAEYGIAKVGFTNDIDNEITGADILKLLVHVAEDGAKSPNKEKLLTGAYLAAADINGDGKVDSSDILPFMKLHNEILANS